MTQPNSTGQQQTPLIKVHQIDGLPFFTADQKQHYKVGLTGLWQTIESSPQGSPQSQEAYEKLRQASQKIMQQMGRNGRPPSGGGPQQQPQQQQQQQQRPNVSQPGAGQGQAGMAQSVNMAQQGSQGAGQQGQQAQGQLPPGVLAELRSVKLNIPAHYAQQGPEAATSYRQAWSKRGAQVLTRREQAKSKGQRLQQMQQQGVGNPQQLQEEMRNCQQEMQKMTSEWNQMKQTNASFEVGQQGQGMQRQTSQQGVQQQVNGAAQQQQSQDMQRPGSMQGMQQQQSNPVKMEMEQPTSLSPQQPQRAFQQQQAPTSQHQVAPSPVVQQQQNMAQQPTSAHPQQTPQTATQTQPPQNYPQQNDMAQQQQPQSNQQRPPMHPQQMSQTAQNMGQPQQPQHSSTPTTAMPQSATQQQPPQQPQPQQQQQQQQQRPQPLTHQAAMSQAAESYSRQQSQNQPQNQQQQNIPQIPNGLPLNGPPSVTTQQTPTSAYPALQPPGQGASVSATTKFPIPQKLNLDPRTQVPVQGAPSRPTYANAGMMQQPGIQRPAQFTLEGEGDRVLSKRKLDELVRQVTGNLSEGTSSSSNNDQNALTPDVEEAVLTFADDFVNNVITSACRLAKLRTSQTLDIRDVQMVLERNYGIRIPGYGLDEVRTVRKFQPAPGWTSKMQAVQAGKVMGGNAGRDA